MKTYKRLFEQIASFENLWQAAHRARRGKRFSPPVLAFHGNLEEELLSLRNELLSGDYRPGPYREFTLRDRKRRHISAAPYRDRVVHHALCGVIEPLFERSFIFDSYACRVGKGTHAALDRFTHFARAYPYALRCDIRKYFPSIDHQILMQLLARRIACRRTLELIEVIVEGSNPQEPAAWYFPGDGLFSPSERRRGLPIGNQTSQFFANLYLDGFDHFVQEELRFGGYLRYADDFVLFGPEKRALWEARSAMIERLAELRLLLHPRKSTVYRTADGIPFLGFRVYPEHRRLASDNVRRFVHRLRRQQKAWAAGEMTMDEIRRSLQAWVGHAMHGNTYGLRKTIFSRHRFSRASGGSAARGGMSRNSPCGAGRVLQQ